MGIAKKKKTLGTSLSKKWESASYKIDASVISRRNQNGTIVLMKTYKAISFYKVDGVATEVWKCFEAPQTIATVTEHLLEFFPKREKTLSRDITAFVKKLVELELLVLTNEKPSSKFPTILPEALKFDTFGSIQEFNLEKIEKEVLEDSLYLDVFAGSDLRLKNEIAPIQNALEKVLQLDGITHSWKKNAKVSNPKATRAGLIAQQVALLMPELVRRDKATGMLAVDYQKFSSYLVESLKDLNRIVEAQDARIRKLETTLKQ